MTTCLIGKWHLGSKSEWGPNRFGFDHAFGSLAGGVSPWNHRYKQGPYSITWHRNGQLLEQDGHVTDLLTDEAIAWIRSRRERPFFLYVPFTAIHLPLKEPQRWVDDAPATIQGEVARHYAASIMHLDHSIGRILHTLEEVGKRDNTLVVFTSDNGASIAENNDLKYPDDNCPSGPLPGNNLPLRGRKGTIYEGGTRVPTLVSWPKTITAGNSSTPSCIVDWMPTFCNLAGHSPTQDLKWDGVDLSRMLIDGKSMPNRSIYIAGPRWGAVSVRAGDWKLVVTERNKGSEVELFNVQSDMGEKQNLVKQMPEKVAKLSAELRRLAENDRDAMVD